MIPKVGRGDRVGGLMAYLVGPGRSNEHTDPHLVAGDPAVMAWHDDNELSGESGRAIARHIDQTRRARGTEVKGGHVWHCSLSLPPQDGELADEQWAQIAESFMTRMGFDDAEGTKAPMRWAAVRHGLSGNGNDHIHLVVNLVREDGTKASIHQDYRRAQKACRELEVEHGLTRLESEGRERSQRAYTHAEKAAHARRTASTSTRSTAGHGVPRRDLANAVRGCATASADEAEFVRRLRREGVLVRPRFADGRADVVVGYSVAQRPPKGERPIWFGGGSLARDLTLPRLRQDWPDSPEHATAAAGEWTAAKRHRRPVSPGRESAEVDPQTWRTAQRRIAAVREHLRNVPVEDRDAWASVARETSGVLAYWSRRVDGEQADALRRAAEALSISAQTHRAGARRPKSYRSGIGGATLLMASALSGGRGAVGAAVLVRQLATLAKTVHDAHIAAGDAVRAQQIAAMEKEQLRAVAARLPVPSQADLRPVTSGPGAPVRTPGPALPPRPEAQRRPNSATTAAGRGIER